MRQQFLAGADVVLTAVSDQRVADAWDTPSILAQQSVGSLAGHLARGSVWVVGEYLARSAPAAGSIDVDTAADYYATVGAGLTDADHEAIRARGAEVAATGRDAIVTRLSEAVAHLGETLPAEPEDRLVTVYGDLVMRLDDYLWTRIVEQVVHLDDLARSLHVDPWPNPPDAEALVIACGAEIGRLRHGGTEMLRALFRERAPGVLPVL